MEYSHEQPIPYFHSTLIVQIGLPLSVYQNSSRTDDSTQNSIRSFEGLELSHLRVCSGLFRAFGLGHLHCIRINKVFLLTALYKAILLQYNILYNCTHRNVKREKLHSQCILLDRIQSNVIRQILTFEGRYLI